MQAKTNPKAFWAYTRQNLKTKCGVAPLLSDVHDENSLKFSDNEKANILQRQFTNVYTREPEEDMPSFDERTDSLLQELHITEEMISKQLNSLNVNKSCGPDNVHACILRELADQVAGPLTYLFNLTIENGIIPIDWKQSFVSPIYNKRGQKVWRNITGRSA